jgi:hypothetical protein
MTNQELIEMAEKVYGKCDWHDSALAHLEQLAKLVIEHEREECAKMVMPLDESLADEIRARGKE